MGQTQGRDKLDDRNLYALPVKEIFLEPLHPHWRSIHNPVERPDCDLETLKLLYSVVVPVRYG